MGNIKELKVTRIRGVKLPTRATPDSAGIDVYVPMDLTRIDMNKTVEMTKCDIRVDTNIGNGTVSNIVIGPGEQALIPTGLKINVPKGYMLKVEDRSSVATLKGLKTSAGIIDSDYEGEILISLYNVTNRDNKTPKQAVLCPGDKFAQLVLYPIETPEVVEIETPVELFKDKHSERGEGGFGSTDSDKK